MNVSDAFLNHLTAAFNDGRLAIYGGTKPASANSDAPSSPLALLELPLAAFNSATDGACNVFGQWFGTVVVDGLATWFRLMDKGGQIRIDGTVGTTADFDLRLGRTDLYVGGVVTVTNFSITMPIAS